MQQQVQAPYTVEMLHPSFGQSYPPTLELAQPEKLLDLSTWHALAQYPGQKLELLLAMRR